MKLAIRFVDQIVGALIILALGGLVFVIFMLGSSQRWFSRDYRFKTYFTSASGLSQNMPVQYKGFKIGNVKNFDLSDDDRVEVQFTIFDTYIDRVREGSLVEVLASPIPGMGSQFVFYPGTGTEPVQEGETIPAVNSTEGKRMLATGLAMRPERDDSINNIMNRAGTLLATLNDTVAELQGSDQTDLGRIVRNLGTASGELPGLVETLPRSVENTLNELMAQIEPILKNLNELSTKLAAPDGTVMAILDSEGAVYRDVVNSLDAISATLRNLEKTSDFIPTQLPQVAAVLADLHTALKTAEDVLIALTNNPLLKRGIPEHRETRAGGARPRDLEF
jgi:phospholipid/cholesterol/gamma-HCH transport system substrate-binding protein